MRRDKRGDVPRVARVPGVVAEVFGQHRGPIREVGTTSRPRRAPSMGCAAGEARMASHELLAAGAVVEAAGGLPNSRCKFALGFGWVKPPRHGCSRILRFQKASCSGAGHVCGAGGTVPCRPPAPPARPLLVRDPRRVRWVARFPSRLADRHARRIAGWLLRRADSIARPSPWRATQKALRRDRPPVRSRLSAEWGPPGPC